MLSSLSRHELIEMLIRTETLQHIADAAASWAPLAGVTSGVTSGVVPLPVAEPWGAAPVALAAVEQAACTGRSFLG